MAKKLTAFVAYALSFFILASYTAYASNNTSSLSPLSQKQVAAIITKSDFNPGFQISATPEVVSEINRLRRSKQARLFIQESLQRMKPYQSIIQAERDKKNMPKELLAIPLIESGYRTHPQKENMVNAMGLWQMTPQTGRNFGLTINAHRDDRLNTQLSTAAAFTYLNAMHEKFNNWMLAVLAYEYGEAPIQKLVAKVGSNDVWVLAKSASAPKILKKSLSTFDATVIVMNNPSLVSD
jgi:membrane-bound lytic murein transglycosylase D